MNEMRKLMETIDQLENGAVEESTVGGQVFVVITGKASVGGREDIIHGVYTKKTDAKKAVMEVKRYFKAEDPSFRDPVFYEAVPFNGTPQMYNGGS